jgi:ferritin-like protein
VSEYHEPENELSSGARDLHRAVVSLKEELEAVDWYHQRWEASADEGLRAILAHNRDEEIEHACMLLEWLRRTVPKWDEQLRKYLFSEAAITDSESPKPTAPVAQASGAGRTPPAPAASGDLGIGSLRRKS